MYVGAVRGGSEAPWDSGMCGVIKIAGRILDELRPPDGSTGMIDLVMQMPGTVIQVPYEGIRTGLFSKRDKMLQIQVSVPKEHVAGVGAGQFLIESMRKAIALAEKRFTRSGIDFDSERQLSWVTEVADALSSRSEA